MAGVTLWWSKPPPLTWENTNLFHICMIYTTVSGQWREKTFSSRFYLPVVVECGSTYGSWFQLTYQKCVRWSIWISGWISGYWFQFTDHRCVRWSRWINGCNLLITDMSTCPDERRFPALHPPPHLNPLTFCLQAHLRHKIKNLNFKTCIKI